jgi:prepilin-type N-terminal cleavage/methylation domain-containing protein/prepilin-type processing-associated H-X9-DG protein
MSRTKLFRDGGFTLVELLVVTGILGLLISIMLPSLNAAREHARQVQCMSIVRQLDTAFLMYAQNNRGYLPASALGGRYNDWIFWESNRNIDGSALAPYLAMGINQAAAASAKPRLSPDLFRCPSDYLYHARGAYNGYKYSYSMNELLGAGWLYCDVNGTPLSNRPVFIVAKLTKMKTPFAKVIVYEEDAATLDDGNGDPRFPGGTGPLPGAPNLLGIRHDRTVKKLDLTWGSTVPNPKAKGNVGYADGSVRYTTRQDFHDARCWNAGVVAP